MTDMVTGVVTGDGSNVMFWRRQNMTFDPSPVMSDPSPVMQVRTPENSSGSVLSAMSGGVDSSVATTLLQEAGHPVAGITMDLFDRTTLAPDTDDSCCTKSAIEEARKVCQALGIEHIVADFKDMFATDVMRYFCMSYLSGETPNPCIACNKSLKIGALQRMRAERSMDLIATGHYVRTRFNAERGAWELLRGVDPHKDQSYALYHLTQDDLEHMIFPLGTLTKSEVRALAQTRKLPTAQRQESQDICFVPDGDHVAFIEHFMETSFAPGDIVDLTGKTLGEHHGLVRYTTGQRKGIGIAYSEPLYVWGKDVTSNQLIVAPREDMLCSEIRLEDVNMISGKQESASFEATVKTNYNQKPIAATCELDSNGSATIRFKERQIRPASGQAAVLYDGEVVLGGGTIYEQGQSA